MTDLFETQDQLPEELQAVILHYSRELENGDPYEICRDFLAAVQRLGYSFEYGLDGEPYDLTHCPETARYELELEEYEILITSYHEQLAETGMAYAMEGFSPGEALEAARAWIGPAPVAPTNPNPAPAKPAEPWVDIPY